MTPSQQIDTLIQDQKDWKGTMLSKIRTIIHKSDPGITEEWKWSTPVWSHNGMVCAFGIFKDHIKINFFKGASIPDEQHLFNSGLAAKTSRSIDLYENDSLNEKAFQKLIESAISYNIAK